MISFRILFRWCAPALFISAGLQAATIHLSSYRLLASFHSDGQYDLSGADTWNGQPLSPANMPNFGQRELSETFNFYGDSTALNVLYVQVTDVSTTRGANWFGTAFDNVTLTGIRVNNTDPVTVLGFSNAFANPGQILAAGGATSEVTSPLQTTPGYTLTQGSNQFWISTASAADYGFTSLLNITGANRIRGGGLFQLTFAPYINVAGFDYNFWNVQAEYGNSNQFIPAQLVTPEPSPYLLTLAGFALLCVCRRSRLSAR